MIRVRRVEHDDVDRVVAIFRRTYGDDYAHPEFFDPERVRRLVYDEGTELLVAEDTEADRLVGTASVVMHIGAYGDLVGEFGRLVVDEDCRGRGIGRMLMEARLKAVSERLHVGLVENRCAHSFSQRISHKYGFAAVGFVPGKLRIAVRESIALYARYFGPALALRRNNPRLVPEVYPLAARVLSNCGLPVDPIVADGVPGYVEDDGFEIEAMSTEGYANLLRIERGRVHHREIFGPLRLHYGLFQLEARHSQYLIAREGEQVVGAIGFTRDEYEGVVRIFELIDLEDRCVHHLLTRLLELCRNEWGVEYVEADVSAYAPRMQRTLLNLEFVPTAYVPAMVFHDVERLDAVKFSRLLVPVDLDRVDLSESARPVADLVRPHFAVRNVHPDVLRAIPVVGLFRDGTEEQARALASICVPESFAAGGTLFREGEPDEDALLVLRGEVVVTVDGRPEPVGTIGVGECLGELSLVDGTTHTTTATARTDVSVARIPGAALRRLVRVRPDIGVLVYRNLAIGAARKLRRSTRQLVDRT